MFLLLEAALLFVFMIETTFAFGTSPRGPSLDDTYSRTWRNAVESGDKARSIYESSCKKWLHSNKAPDVRRYSFTIPPLKRYRTPFDHTIGTRAVWQVDVDKDRSNADLYSKSVRPPHENLFDTQRGLIICHSNWKKGTDLHLSDLLFESYVRVAHRQSAETNRRPLSLERFKQSLKWHPRRLKPPRFIVRTSIATPETTMVLELAHARRAQHRRREGRNIESMETFTPKHPEFNALFGTIHGKSILYMLSDYCRWSRRSRVRAIRTKQVPLNQDMQPGWWMLFELERR